MIVSIFTPTYNRQTYLPRLYNSLLTQNDKNFEWIVIDDNSTDDTEKLIHSYIKEKKIKIIYLKQEHGGKHRAFNKAIQVAHGEMFFIVDSDDYITNDAVSWIRKCSTDIMNIPQLAGIVGLKKHINNGKIAGGRPKIDKNSYIDVSNFERGNYNLLGDKAEVYKTEILKKYPFPEFEGEYFVTEAVCWDAIAADGYKLRWYNRVIYYFDYLDTGLTKTGANKYEGRMNNFQGYCYYIKQCLKVMKKIDSIIYFRQYNKTCSYMNKPFFSRAKYIELSKLHYMLYFFIKQPFFYGLRLIKKKISSKC